MTYDEAMRVARTEEAETGERRYVVRCHDGEHIVVMSFPLIGTWWSTDGIRHG